MVILESDNLKNVKNIMILAILKSRDSMGSKSSLDTNSNAIYNQGCNEIQAWIVIKLELKSRSGQKPSLN